MYSQLTKKNTFVSSITYIHLFIGTCFIFLIMSLVTFSGYFVMPIIQKLITDSKIYDIVRGCIFSVGCLILVIFASFFHFKNWYGKVGKCASSTVSFAFGLSIGIISYYYSDSFALPLSFAFLVIAVTSALTALVILALPGRYLIITTVGSCVGVGITCISFVIFTEGKTKQMLPVIMNRVIFAGIVLVSIIIYYRDRDQYNTRYYCGAFVVYIITFPGTFLLFLIFYAILFCLVHDGVESKFK